MLTRHCRVLVTNVTKAPLRLTEGTVVAEATWLYRDDELLFEMPCITASLIGEAPQVLEVDPSYQVDLSGAEPCRSFSSRRPFSHGSVGLYRKHAVPPAILQLVSNSFYGR
uniref:Uncharacterized protein n=1 Tax=Ditylenchus dipsaci TaxID=166011 RepID=A0A915EPY3_9BILA